MSHPARGVWIEIINGYTPYTGSYTSHPARGVWIEIGVSVKVGELERSHPARGVWIEMLKPEGDYEVISRTPQGVCGLKYFR